VIKGETLYAIAFQNNVDYRELAIWNNIENLNVIKVGTVLHLVPPSAAFIEAQQKSNDPVVTPLSVATMPSASTERPLQNSTALKTEPRAGKIPYSDQTFAKLESDSAAALPHSSPMISSATTLSSVSSNTASSSTVVPTQNVANEIVDWAWPVNGNMISVFTELNKGIDIGGTRGAAISAAAIGTVIHTGAGIRGYGRLVIIKHGSSWVSAYAHNEKIIVVEGQQVKQGQKIAEMGNSDADQVKLHFEIRKQGKPVDPAKLLPAK